MEPLTDMKEEELIKSETSESELSDDINISDFIDVEINGINYDENNIQQYSSVDLDGGVKKRKVWVAPNNIDKASEGEFAKIFKQLKNNNEAFMEHFQISYKKFSELLGLIKPYIKKKKTNFRVTISPAERLAVSLRYISTGQSIKKIATDYKIGCATVSTIVHEVVEAIADVLPPIIMKRPSEETWQKFEQRFNEEYSFPNCVGIIDGREFTVQVTSDAFSLVLLSVIDPDSKFVIVNVGDYDKLVKGGLLKNSMLGKLLESELLRLPPDKPIDETDNKMPHFFNASKIVKLKNNVMRPYPKVEKIDTNEQYNFNQCLYKTLEPADKAFKMLLNYYKIYQNRLLLKPDYAKNLILATCCLHNFLIDERKMSDSVESVNKYVCRLPPYWSNSTIKSINVRDYFKNHFAKKMNLENKDSTS